MLELIESFTQLETLKIKSNNLTQLSAPYLFNVLFKHPFLTFVDLSYNPIGLEFSEKLDEYKSVLNWQTLKLKETNLNCKILSKLFLNLHKLLHMDHLDISYNELKIGSLPPCDRISASTVLTEIVIGPKDCLYKLKTLFDIYPNWKLINRKHGVKESSENLAIVKDKFSNSIRQNSRI